MSRRRARRLRRAAHGGAEPLAGGGVAGTLDLHGQTRPSAEALVRNFVSTWHARGGRAVVRIVTGKGFGSGGTPVLGPAVERLLATELRALVSRWEPDAGGGAYLVKLR